MSDKTVRLLIDLTYDAEVMHGDDEESVEWFNSILLRDDLQLGDFGDLGDMIGSVKVIEHGADRIEELEAQLAKAEWLLVEAKVQLEEGKAKTRRNRADLIGQFIAELKGDNK